MDYDKISLIIQLLTLIAVVACLFLLIRSAEKFTTTNQSCTQNQSSSGCFNDSSNNCMYKQSSGCTEQQLAARCYTDISGQCTNEWETGPCQVDGKIVYKNVPCPVNPNPQPPAPPAPTSGGCTDRQLAARCYTDVSGDCTNEWETGPCQVGP